MAGLGDTIRMMSRTRRGSVRRSGSGPSRLHGVQDFGPNPGGLSMLAYAPAALAPQSSLVVVLHGCTQTAEGYAQGAGWIEAAERFGFALLCPEQTPANNPNVCFNWFVPGDTRRGGGEAASIAQMIAHMIRLHDIDPSRVFITGLSAGGAMANVLLATYPELFSGGAIIAGLPYGSAGNVQEAFAAMAHQRRESDETLGDRVRTAAGSYEGPWPAVSVWHGDADATVSHLAGDAVARQWANVHRLSASASSVSGAQTRRAWRSPAGLDAVEHHSIRGMGHGTPLGATGPDTVGAAGPYLLEVGVSSTLLIATAWGLTGDASRQPAKTPSAQDIQLQAPEPAREPAKPVSAVPRPGRLPGTTAIDVGEVINNALRAAGLMK